MRYLVGLAVGFAVGAFVALTSEAVSRRWAELELEGTVAGSTDEETAAVAAHLAAMGVQGVS